MKYAVALFLLWFISFQSYAMQRNNEAETGILSGKVIDAQTGETLIGVSVVLDDDFNNGIATDLDGNFILKNIIAGSHSVKLTSVGYKPYESSIEIAKGQVHELSVPMENATVEIQEVVVVAEVKKNYESAIYIMQKNASVLATGIASEDIKKSPDKNAGEAIKRISGVCLQDGQYAVIRGLSDRYNMATVNGISLPSSEADRKAFALDMLPSNLIDNIIVVKSAQSDMPSEFAGGIININTKDIPDKFFLNFSTTQTAVIGSVFKPYLSYQGGELDFLGIDDGSRSLNDSFPASSEITKLSKFNKAKYEYAKELTGDWGTIRKKMAIPGQGWQLSTGFSATNKEVKVGGILALSYSNSQKTVETYDRQEWNADSTLRYLQHDFKHTNSVAWNGLANLNTVITSNHKLGIRAMVNTNTKDNVLEREDSSGSAGKTYYRTGLDFVTSQMQTYSMNGEHYIPGASFKINWFGAYVKSVKTQPMSRRYAYYYNYNGSENPLYLAAIPNSYSNQDASIFYGNMNDHSINSGIDLSYSFDVLKQKQMVKFGYFMLTKNREYQARALGFIRAAPAGTPFDIQIALQSPDSLFTDENVHAGGLTIDEVTNKSDQYSAESELHAGYVLLENNFHERFKLVWGLRLESFRQQMKTFNYSLDSIYRNDKFLTLLPSLNAIYKLSDRSNLRFSFSSTTSRPEFRELSAYAYYDFNTNNSIVGDPNLKQTIIYNADLRYEFFPGKIQAITIAGFYKHLKNPIELVSAASSGDVNSYFFSGNNAADNFGGELELRKHFGFMNKVVEWKQWENFSVNTNFAYIYSRIHILDSNAVGNKNRPLQGQAPYVVNAGLQYNEPNVGFTANALFNIIGSRIISAGNNSEPDLYENSRPVLDFQVSQKIFKEGMIRLTVSDVLARPSIQYYQEAGNRNSRYQEGVNVHYGKTKNYTAIILGLSYTI